MRKKVIVCLKVAWTVAALMILLVGTNVCVSTDEACGAAGDTMLLFMVLLTFPTGVIFLPMSMAVVASAIIDLPSTYVVGHFPSDYIIGWFVMALGGCLQWLFIVPRLLEKPKLTLLRLNSTPLPTPISSPVPVTNYQPAIPTSTRSTAAVATAPIKTRVRKRENQVRSFDRLGRTPLERVINR